ncbi:nucleophosmin-like [Glossophaga mutica]
MFSWCNSVLHVCLAEQKSVISIHLLSHLSVEDLMDMDMSPLRPQNCLFSCKLKPDKDYHFKVDNDVYQLSLQKIHLGAGTKDELHIAEAEAMNYKGSPLTTLRMSVQSTFSLGSFEVIPLVVLKLKCGSGPVHISRQHLVAVKEDAESEDEEEEDVKLLNLSGKCTFPGSCIKFPQKKLKGATDEDDDDDKNGEDDDDGSGDALRMKKLKKSVQDTQPKNAQKFNLNGEDSKTINTRDQKVKNPSKKQETTPKSLKGTNSVEIKVKMQAS